MIHDPIREVGKRTRLVKPRMTEDDKQSAKNQLDSLISPNITLHYNEQLALISFILTTRKGSFARSLILKHLNDEKGCKKIKAANEMVKPQWYTVRGTKKKSLKELRTWQRKLFLTPAIVSMKI